MLNGLDNKWLPKILDFQGDSVKESASMVLSYDILKDLYYTK